MVTTTMDAPNQAAILRNVFTIFPTLSLVLLTQEVQQVSQVELQLGS